MAVELWKTKGISLKLDNSYYKISQDYPLDFILKKIEDNYFPLCRKIQCQNTCHLYSEEVKGESCLLMHKIMENYVQTTAQFVQKENQRMVEKYLNSIISLVSFFKLAEEWKADLSLNWSNWFYRGLHNKLMTSNSLKQLSFIHDFVQNSIFLYKDIQREYMILVEGPSEERSFKILSSRRLLNPTFTVLSLDGKDKARIDRLRFSLKRLQSERNEFFIILDGKDDNVKEIKAAFLREDLLKASHFPLWKSEFEDSFNPKDIYHGLEKIHGELNFTLNELEKELETGNGIIRSIEKISYQKGAKVEYEPYKVKVAMEAASNMDLDDDCELVTKIKRFNEIIEEEQNEYYFVDPKKALKDIEDA